MRVMAQMAMVMNLDKCIGCHTCSVTCKQAWTNRAGTEYVWFNNVETRPGLGYPRGYEDQDEWQGGWVTHNGRLRLRAGGRLKKLLTIFSNPKMPSIQDYYEPWTYDYETLTNAPLQEHTPVARPVSLISGQNTKITWSANWDDDLGGTAENGPKDPMLKGIEDQVSFEFEKAFMFYLPRICEHCLNPSCVAACPSGAMYKRSEDGIVLVDQDDAVLGPLVDGPRRAGGGARRVEAVLADARQVEHERPLELELHLVLGVSPDPLDDRVAVRDLGTAGKAVVPVRAPLDRHRLAGEQRLRLGDREVVAERGVGELLVVIGPGLVVVPDVRQQRVGEDRQQLLDPAARPELEPAVAAQHPAAPPPLLVLVAARVALSGPGLDVVEPHVLDAAAVGPGLLARDRAGVAADALVEVHDHAQLGHHAHVSTPPSGSCAAG